MFFGYPYTYSKSFSKVIPVFSAWMKGFPFW